MGITLYALNPIYTFAQIANDMVSTPSRKLIVSTEYRSTEKFIDNFFMDRFEVTQESYQTISNIIRLFWLIKSGLSKR